MICLMCSAPQYDRQPLHRWQIRRSLVGTEAPLSLHWGMTVLAQLTGPFPNTHTPPPPPPCAPPLVYLQPWGLVQLWGELTVSCALLWGTMRGDSLPLTTCCAAAWVQFQGRLSAASPISPLVLSIQNTHFLHFCNLQLLRCLDWDPGGACWH